MFCCFLQVFIVNVLLAIVQQWVIPTAINSLQPFKDMEYPRMIERVLLLAVSSVFMMIIGLCTCQYVLIQINTTTSPAVHVCSLPTPQIPNHLFWLLGFYWMFHSLTNLTAELLRFGDRTFYRDWWNSDSISRFWRTWNIPVHRWASRYV